MIIGLTDRGASFPRLGILRKGGVKPNDNRPGADLKDHFRLDADDPRIAIEFARLYGDKPNGIRVMFYGATTEENFEAWQEHWSAGSLKHRCDGQTCTLSLLPDGSYSTEPLPCPSLALKAQNPAIDKKHLCRPAGRLKVIIPELGALGYILVTTTSIHDIIELQQNLEAAEALRGDLRGIPFILSRRPRKVSTPNGDGPRRRLEKWLLSLEPAGDWVRLQITAMQRAALPDVVEPLQLPAPVDEETGEILDGASYEAVDEDEPQQPAYPQMTAAEAEDRFWARYGAQLGGTEWTLVQTLHQNRAPKPDEVRGWIAVAEATRDELKRRQENTERRVKGESLEELYAGVEETERQLTAA